MPTRFWIVATLIAASPILEIEELAARASLQAQVKVVPARRYTVDELAQDSGLVASAAGGVVQAAAIGGSSRRIQVRGDLVKESVERAAEGLELRFRIAYRDVALPVRYTGVVPDTFELAEQVTVGGTIGPDGVFQADQLFVQCPSKYEAQPPGAATAPASGLDG